MSGTGLCWRARDWSVWVLRQPKPKSEFEGTQFYFEFFPAKFLCQQVVRESLLSKFVLLIKAQKPFWNR